jgi:hypothetical protein
MNRRRAVHSKIAGGSIVLLIACAFAVTAVRAQGTNPPDEAKRCRDQANNQLDRDGAQFIMYFAGKLLAFETVCPHPMNRVGERVYWLARDAARLCARQHIEWKCAPDLLESNFGAGYRDAERELSSVPTDKRLLLCTAFLDELELRKVVSKLEAATGPFAATLRSLDQDPDSLKRRCERGWANDQTPDRK